MLSSAVEYLTGAGVKCGRVSGDVRKTDDCKRAVEEAAKLFGHLDILINCAAGKSDHTPSTHPRYHCRSHSAHLQLSLHTLTDRCLLADLCCDSFLCPAEDLSSNGFRTVLDIDTIGTFNMCSAAFPHVSTTHCTYLP